ncbi:hypothetical protein ONS96_002877 [Cadophora gregata f. sp. sojae]|nr:hypothetical protein ONS96_002877 [Cadophora gregata f. sp. sojae]
MISSFRSPRTCQWKISLPSHFHLLSCLHPALVCSYHAGRAGSVNTAIQRGLRKSKGTAFRGPRNPRADDPREVYRARTGLHLNEFAIARVNSAARRQEARSGPQNDILARSKLWTMRGRTGVKNHGKHSSRHPMRSEAIPRPKGSRDLEMRGRFGETLTPRIRKVEHTRSRSSRGTHGEASYNPSASTSRFGTGSGTHAAGHSFRTQYGLGSEDSASKVPYLSLSFRDRSSGSPTSKSYDSRFGAPGGPSTIRCSQAKFESTSLDHLNPPRACDRLVRLGKKKLTNQTSDRVESRSPWLKREFTERQFTKGKVGKRGTGSTGGSVKTSHGEIIEDKQSLGWHNDGNSSSTPHQSLVFDRHIPLSIPYTTPASEFLYGTSVVEAAIVSSRSPKRKLYKLYIYTGENRENLDQDSRLERLAWENGIPVLRVGTEWVRLMDKMSNGRPHNGYILEASPLPRLPVTRLGAFRSDANQEGFEVSVDHQSREEAAINGTSDFIQTKECDSGRKPLVLLLDSIVDPGNLGGIIRTASFLGVSAIAISARNSASLTPVVLKASAGASENIPLFSVNKPAGFIVDSKSAGWRVYAAVAPSRRNDPSMPASLSTVDLGDPLSKAPCILMLGNEGEGLRWNLRSKADINLYIQGSGQSFNVDSLNKN